MLFLTCVTIRDGETGKIKYTAIPFCPLGLPWSDLTEEPWNQTLTRLKLPGLKLGNDSRDTRLLHLVVKLRSN